MTLPAAGLCPTSRRRVSWRTAERLARTQPGPPTCRPPTCRRGFRRTVTSVCPSPGGKLAPVVCASERSRAMSEKRRALGRGLGALIPTAPVGDGRSRPMDVFFRDNSAGRPGSTTTVSRETPPNGSAQINGSGPGQDNGWIRGDNAAVAATSVDQIDDSGLDLAPVPGARYAELSVLSIRPNPRQPRQVFDDDDMAELVNSIREVGVLQPVVVRPIPAEELDSSAGQGPDGVERPQFELIIG